MAFTKISNTITSGAANTKGAYFELSSSTPYDSSRIHVQLQSAGVAARFLLIDIATGPVSSETVVISNIAINCDGEAISQEFATFYVDIPAGTRISARCQCVTASTINGISILLENRALASIANPVTYGSNTAASRGTQTDGGAVADTKSAYAQLTASTTADIDELMLCFTVGAQGTGFSGFVTAYIDIATGAASSETIIISDIYINGGVQSDSFRPGIISFPISIPSGTRLSVRHACNSTTAAARLLCTTVIGMQT